MVVAPVVDPGAESETRLADSELGAGRSLPANVGPDEPPDVEEAANRERRSASDEYGRLSGGIRRCRQREEPCGER